ncbi:MAG: hypothetical protein RIR96_782 [Bacteroidota bacterium]
MTNAKKESPVLVRITTVPISLKVLLKGQMKFMKSNGFEVIMISDDGPEVDALVEQEGCEHITTKLTRKITPLQDLISLIKLTGILKKINPDIVHTHTPKAGLIGMWAAYFARVPVRLHTIAGLPWVESDGLLKKILIAVEKCTAFPAHAVFPNSKKQMAFLKEHGIAKNKMNVLGHGSSNGINLNFFSPNDIIKAQGEALKEKSRLKSGGWIWVFVGRVVKDKGIAELLTAFDQVVTQYPNDQLWLVGNMETNLDPLDEKDMRMIHEHENIIWWDYQQDVRPFLLASDVLTFPSYREGFPNVPLQAAALDCMLILSNINGCNEIVEDGVNGMLVEPKSSKALTDAMFFARNNPDIKLQMTEKIRQKIRTHYNQETLWGLLLEEYRKRIQRN